MATTTDLTVINAAATRTGNAPVSALTGTGGPVVSIVLNNYEDMVKAELSLYPWTAASKTALLDRIDADVLGDPPEPWAAAYQAPNDLISIRTVMISGMPIRYEVHGSKILCDAAEGSEVIMKYVWRVPEAQWPAWFREGVTRRLEAIFLRGIGERYNQAEERDKAAAESFALARNRDSQSQTARDPVSSPTLQARGGLLLNSPYPWPFTLR